MTSKHQNLMFMTRHFSIYQCYVLQHIFIISVLLDLYFLLNCNCVHYFVIFQIERNTSQLVMLSCLKTTMISKLKLFAAKHPPPHNPLVITSGKQLWRIYVQISWWRKIHKCSIVKSVVINIIITMSVALWVLFLRWKSVSFTINNLRRFR